MKLSIAGRIVDSIPIVDADLAATQDVNPSYSDIVDVFSANYASSDAVAQTWLDHKAPFPPESGTYSVTLSRVSSGY